MEVRGYSSKKGKNPTRQSNNHHSTGLRGFQDLPSLNIFRVKAFHKFNSNSKRQNIGAQYYNYNVIVAYAC